MSQVSDGSASTVPASPAATEDTGSRGIAIAMYCMLLIAYGLMAADRYLFPVLATDARREFGFSLANTGLLSTIFTLGLGLGGLPTGFLLSRLTRKTVLITGVAIFSAGIASTTIAVGFWTMLLCLAVTGLGMAMLATSMFALAASYFVKYRAAAVGSCNFFYGLGGVVGPILAGVLLATYHTWRAPMRAFGLFGFVMIVLILLTVRSWFTETRRVAEIRTGASGATSLWNMNSAILTVLCIIHGISMYGFLGLYPLFLRERLHYSPALAGFVISFFGWGALASIPGGWLGDRLSPRLVLSSSFLCIAVLGYYFFQPTGSPLLREVLTCIYGVVGSAVLYVNLAGYHVKALRGTLASRGSGMFVSSLYGGAAFGGYLLGRLATGGQWMRASEIQMSLFCLVGAVLALALRPKQMAL